MSTTWIRLGKVWDDLGYEVSIPYRDMIWYWDHIIWFLWDNLGNVLVSWNNVRNFLYMQGYGRYTIYRTMRAYSSYYSSHHSAPLLLSLLLLSSLRSAIAIVIIITPLGHRHRYYYHFARSSPSLLLSLRSTMIVIIVATIVIIIVAIIVISWYQL